MNARFLKNIFIAENSDESFLEKYAVLLTFALCMFFAAVTFLDEGVIHPGNLLFLFGVSAAIALVIAVYFSKTYKLTKIFTAMVFAVALLICYLWVKALGESDEKAIFIFSTAMIVCLGAAVYFTLTNQMTVNKFIVIIFLLGFFLRLCYTLYTSAVARQHDVYGYDSYEIRNGEYYLVNGEKILNGHSGYIAYFYKNGLLLPQFDVTKVDQFYHPPLHHMICALWWKIQSAFGVNDWFAQQNIQALTLFYSSVSLILTYKIFKQLKLNGLPLVIAFAIVAFHPTFVIFAGSINNDILSITLMLAALYYALKWYESNSMLDLVWCALSIGFGMMTKLSVYMICIPIGFIFAVKFFKDIKADRTTLKPHLIKFGVFLAICAPIGLFWGVRNAILYNVPIAYVAKFPEDSWQYVGPVVNTVGAGGYSAMERLFDFGGMFKGAFDNWTNRGDMLYNEYNPMVSLLKTSMFGEFINGTDYPTIKFSGTVLFWIGNILALCGLASAVFVTVRTKRKNQPMVKVLALLLGYVFMIVFYYIFCFTYPHHCTENIRYISPTIIYGAAFIALALKDINEGENIKLKVGFNVSAVLLTFLFALFSTITLVAIG